MRNRFLEILEFQVGQRELGAFAAMLGAMGSGSIWITDIAAHWKAFFVIALVVYLAWECRSRGLWGGHRGVAGATLLPGGDWLIAVGSDRAMRGVLKRSWGKSLGPVIALEWECDDGTNRQAWLFEWQVQGDIWRRLRVRLRLS